MMSYAYDEHNDSKNTLTTEQFLNSKTRATHIHVNNKKK